METPPTPDKIYLNEIDDSLRFREDYGDESVLKATSVSIREFGLIQPLVVSWDDNRWKLLVGGRRYRVLKQYNPLGRDYLIHGKEILTREELTNPTTPELQYRARSIELEENVRRKDMTWQETLKAKTELKRLWDEIYGVRGMGGATKEEMAGAGIDQTGNSLRKMAAALGESPALVSQDLKLADAMTAMPQLAKMETKSAAWNKMQDIMKMMVAYKAGQSFDQQAAVKAAVSYRVLVYVDSEEAQVALVAELEGKGFKCEPIIV